MPDLPCTGCGERMVVNIGEAHNQPSKPERLIGSAICRKCKSATGFELQDNMISYISGKGIYGSLNTGLSEIAKTLYAEAEMCFRSGAPDASTAMCRASIEAALTQAGFKGDNLNQQIANAKTAVALDEVEVGLAHASRLITRGAIHRGELIALSDVPSMLSATVRILNKLTSLTAR